ncbi:hypothetical protein B566_EDAN007462 [Ephemera danica]|nr:hypothetical protein B566_EDAN007462 [Ephemera danica]
MENLETVVRERNRAYFELETGESGERPEKLVYNQLGMQHRYRMSEHLIPRFMNRAWREKYKFGYEGAAVHKFLRLYREKIANKEKQRKFKEIKYVRQLFKKFPNIDIEAVKKHHPDVDIDEIHGSKEARGNHEYNG